MEKRPIASSDGIAAIKGFNTMDINIIRESITKKKLEEIAQNQFGDFVKSAVDIERKIMAIGG